MTTMYRFVIVKSRSCEMYVERFFFWSRVYGRQHTRKLQKKKRPGFAIEEKNRRRKYRQYQQKRRTKERILRRYDNEVRKRRQRMDVCRSVNK